jgi:hypothetical protein
MDTPKLLFGQIAVEKRFCTQEQLDQAMKTFIESARRGYTDNLGKVMVALKILTEKQVVEILKIQQAREVGEEDRLFGKLAVQNGFCKEEDIAWALEQQKERVSRKKAALRIGELLVKKGKMKSQERDAILLLMARLNNPNFWKPFESEWQKTQEY